MLIAVDSKGFSASLKTLAAAGADIVKLVATDRLTLVGGRIDKARNLPDAGFLIQINETPELLRSTPGEILVQLKPLLESAERCQGKIVLAGSAKRLSFRGRLGGDARLHLQFRVYTEPLPVAPTPNANGPRVQADGIALAAVINSVSPALPTVRDMVNEGLAEVVLELDVPDNGLGEARACISASNGVLLLQRRLPVVVHKLLLGRALRLPPELGAALKMVGEGEVTLSWGNQFVVEGPLGSVCAPLRSAMPVSLLNLVSKAKPGDNLGRGEVKVSVLLDVLSALKAAASDVESRLSISSVGTRLTLALEGTERAEGLSTLELESSVAGFELGLNLNTFLTAVKSVDVDVISLRQGGPSSMVSLFEDDNPQPLAVMAPLARVAVVREAKAA